MVQFTGKERDAETGLDYFGARYFSSAQGRFTSPDWSATPQPIPYADLKDPQSLNLYSYVRNNPLAKADADGHCFWDLCMRRGCRRLRRWSSRGNDSCVPQDTPGTEFGARGDSWLGTVD